MKPTTSRRQRNRQFTAEEIARIVHLYTIDWPLHQIASDIRCDTRLVSGWLAENGFPLRSRLRIATDDERATVERMYSKGIPKDQIAAAVGVGYPILARWLSEWGLTETAQLRPTDEQEALLRRLFAEGVSVQSMSVHPEIQRTRKVVGRWLGLIGLSVSDRKAALLAEIQERNRAKSETRRKRRPKPEISEVVQAPATPKKEKGVAVRISQPAQPSTKLPAGHMSIMERFRRGVYDPQPVNLEGYRVKHLGEGPAHQGMDVEELLSVKVESDRFG